MPKGDANLENILANNVVRRRRGARWAETADGGVLSHYQAWAKAQTRSFFYDLGREHKPKYFYIGCSDARVPGTV